MPSSQSSLKILNKIWGKLSPKRRKHFLALITLTIISSFAEILSLGSVLPFMNVIAGKNNASFGNIYLDNLLQWCANYINIDFVLLVSGIFLIASLAAGIIRIILVWLSVRLSNAIGADFSEAIFRRTLYQPYEVHLRSNSSNILSAITQQVGAVSGMVSAIVTIITSGTLFLVIILTVLFVNTNIAVSSFAVFGVLYLAIAVMTRKRVLRNGYVCATEQAHSIKLIQEGLGGIRDVVLGGTQEMFCKEYRESIKKIQAAVSENVFIASSPRYAMETLGLVLVSLLIIFFHNSESERALVLPIVGLLGLAAQKSLPLLQQIYGGFSAIHGNKASADKVLIFLNSPLLIQETRVDPTHAELVFHKNISLKDVSFHYKDDDAWIFKNINITILKGSRVGIIGQTGSGKSTITDLLMCLLEPTEGVLLVDGLLINSKNSRQWQDLITHVPQAIFLADVSIAENIAFGIHKDLIDLSLVQEAARQAQIAEFIEALPLSYETIVGERGVRLSGGQRQRIGIARAIYKKAEVLILDEATSALDSETEKAVIDSLNLLSNKLTVIIVAHRLTTLKNCTQVIELNNGEIVRVRSFEEIMQYQGSNYGR